MKPRADQIRAPAPSKEDAIRAGFRRRMKIIDWAASAVITLSGMLIIAAILGIGVFLFIEIMPLFKAASITPAASYALPVQGVPRLLRVEEGGSLGIAVGEAPVAVAVDLREGAAREQFPLAGLENKTVRSASAHPDSDAVALGTLDGHVWVGLMGFALEYSGAKRTARAVIEPHVLHNLERPAAVVRLAHRWGESGGAIAALLETGEVIAVRIAIRRPLIGAPTKTITPVPVALPDGVEARAVLVEPAADHIIVGTSAGELLRFSISGAQAELVQRAAASQAPLTALRFVLGDRTFIAGDANGRLTSWSLAQLEGAAGKTWREVRRFAPMSSAVRIIAPSPRNKSFLAGDETGRLALYHMTTGRLLALSAQQSPPSALAIAPKDDGIWAAGRDGSARALELANPHPEVSLDVLFKPVQYEGHNRPKHIWQSHAASDDFEPKFGLIPLIAGTLKGTFYAMLFSVPLAVFAGLYASQFLDRRFRSPVKSSVELMAALPSVVLGFIAGLVLAPFTEEHLVAVLIVPVIVPAVALLGMALSWGLPYQRVKSFVKSNEIWVLVAWILAGLFLALEFGPAIEREFLGGDAQTWMLRTFGIRYDQRNALVVGWAMGFAVIPLIFTICEDAFSAVPQHLVAASLACGANRWQTAIRVVLPAAGSAVFSAIMVGLGRSIGETMIVLMATGNTPILDASLFNGFRALSANIAVEIPEAPLGSTHYRVLFVTALLLFAMTFVLNTVAEFVRIRLRRNLEGI